MKLVILFGGNIKKIYAYTTSTSLGTAIDTISYGYTNAKWGDLLKTYDGAIIVYDNSGNPTEYYSGGRVMKKNFYIMFGLCDYFCGWWLQGK